MSSDADLVLAARTGCQAAFRAIVQRHRERLLRIACRMVGDRVLAEDIAQETLLVAWRDLGELRESDRLAGWLAGIAKNLGRRAIRRRVRWASAARTIGAAEPIARTPHDETVACEDEARVARALVAIPDTLRRPLVLYYLDGRSVREVACRLALSETAVKQRLLRARNELRGLTVTAS